VPRELQGVLEQLELAALEEARRVRVRAHTSRGRPVREFFRVIGDAPGALPADEGITPGAGGVYDCGNDVEKAARLLGKGRRVALNQPRQVSTLVDDLAAMVEDARKKGKSAPIYDLCRVTVKGTNLFCVESKGIPRIRMPQLKGEPTAGSPADKTVRDKRGEVDLTPSFVEHLKGEGYAIKGDTVPASYLKATQNELNGAKVAGIANFLAGGGTIEGSPLIVDRDNYIVDGHHRWAAQVAVDLKDADPGNDPPMKVLRVDIGIIDLLEDAKKFAAGQGMPQASVAHGGATEHGIGLKEHRLEEFAFPHIGSPLHVHFEPGKHPRGRIGRFIDVLGKLERAEHGSTVTLPHGIMVRRDLHGLQVMGGGHKPVELEHHHAVAAEALFRHTVASGEGHAQLLDEIEHARRQAAPTHGGEALHLAGRAREARVDARRNRRGYLEALTPALFEKGKGRRVYAGEKHPRVEAVLRRIEGRANQATAPPEKPSNDRNDYLTPKKDGEEFGDFSSDDPVEVWLAHERAKGRLNQPAAPSPTGRRSLKPVVFDVPVAGPSPDYDRAPKFEYWSVREGNNDVTQDVKRHVAPRVAADIASVVVSVSNDEGPYWNKETDVKWKDGTRGGNQYEQDHDLGDLYSDVEQEWYWSKQQAQAKKLDLSKVRLGDKVHYVASSDPATGKQGEFKDVGTVIGGPASGLPMTFTLRDSAGRRLERGYQVGAIFGHVPLSEPERKKAVKAEIALQRAHQKKLRDAGQHDTADMNEIQLVRPLLRSIGLKAAK
jgi:hypothetical protein